MHYVRADWLVEFAWWLSWIQFRSLRYLGTYVTQCDLIGQQCQENTVMYMRMKFLSNSLGGGCTVHKLHHLYSLQYYPIYPSYESLSK